MEKQNCTMLCSTREGRPRGAPREDGLGVPLGLEVRERQAGAKHR